MQPIEPPPPPSSWKNTRLEAAMDFDALANQHKDAVYRQMLRVCGNREDAEDVLIEAMFRAFRHLDKLEHPEAFRAWLGQIARRVCFRLKRREALLPLVQLSEMEDKGLQIPSDEAGVDARVDAMQMKELLQGALETLPEANRRVYVLRDLEDQPGEAVAETLGISLAAMKSRLHRARALLRERLDAVIRGNCKEI